MLGGELGCCGAAGQADSMESNLETIEDLLDSFMLHIQNGNEIHGKNPASLYIMYLHMHF